jgi:hypothetical protein
MATKWTMLLPDFHRRDYRKGRHDMDREGGRNGCAAERNGL